MKIVDLGIIVQAKQYDRNEYVVDVLTQKNGRFRGFCTMRTGSITVGSSGIVEITFRKNSNKLKFDMHQTSKVLYSLNQPHAIAGFAAICSSAAKFIPEGCPDPSDFQVFMKYTANIDDRNFMEQVVNWEKYLLENYFEISMSNHEMPHDYRSFRRYLAATSSLHTQARFDLLALLKAATVVHS